MGFSVESGFWEDHLQFFQRRDRTLLDASRDIGFPECHRPVVGRHQAGNALGERRLAASRLADNAQRGIAVRCQVHTVHRFDESFSVPARQSRETSILGPVVGLQSFDLQNRGARGFRGFGDGGETRADLQFG
ncbi:MAG: hypothetical protein OXK76_14070 [Gammaproteobacteria bacterium]|nr:hypothetical protein [Gammaproteobacteria bacterium]